MRKKECGDISPETGFTPKDLILPVRYVKGVGEVRERLLSRLGIKTVEDLLFFFPRRYEDRRNIVALSSLVDGKVASVVARIAHFEKRNTSRRGLSIASVVLSDGRDSARAVWFNRPRLEEVLVPGARIALYGKVEMRGGPQFTNPEFEIIDEDDLEAVGKIVPIYPTTAGLSVKWMRRIVNSALESHLAKVEDYIPSYIRSRNAWTDLREAIQELHRPQGRESWFKARNRLAFDELFLLQTGLLLRRRERARQQEKSGPLKTGKNFKAFLNSLPFALTAAQERVIREVSENLTSEVPMNRLLQGDVGSGKTVVALASMLVAVDSGAQAVLMAPTEILAQQHFFKLREMFSALKIRMELLTGSLPRAERRRILADLADGKTQIVVGTHAVFGSAVEFKKLELVVVDEQHRFGVLQRNALLSKGRAPHVLVMTATPIPRTLTLSIYGDLDVSVLDEMPAGRKPVKTMRLRSSQRAALSRLLRDTLQRGHQAYWVCPLIEESEKLDLTAAYSRFQELEATLPEVRKALLHGQLPADEKEKIMRNFAAGKIDLLVATSVIEVGVDVPNAVVMIIEDAGRFGAAQLHQLRGRVGRGDAESCCILLSGKTTPEGEERLEAMLKTNDGFEISEMDLKLRGPGEVCGIRQHGITDFKVADLVRDRRLLELARMEACDMIEKDPCLKREPLLVQMVTARLGTALDLAGTA